MIEVKVYCGTYGKYNAGSLAGEWLDISDFSDKEEFLAHCTSLHTDDPNPEFMFQDIECPKFLSHLVSESHIDGELWEYLKELNNATYSPDMYEAYCDAAGVEFDGSTISDAEDAYQGEYDSDQDFAQQVAEDIGAVDSKLGWPYTCIDWEYAARELMYDYSSANGFYFRL